MKAPSHPTTASALAIGVDVGGTKIAAGLVRFPEAAVLQRRLVPTGPARGGQAILDDVLALAAELSSEAAAAGTRPEAIGLGVCELVAPSGEILSEHTVAWRKLPVRERLAEIAAATIDADVRAAATAEAHWGAGRGFRQFLYLTVGTGISSCLVLDGQPYAGAHGATGTMASSSWMLPCDQCGHAPQTTLEELASGPALVARYARRQPGKAATGEQVLQAAQAGDPDARNVVENAARALGSAVAWLVNVLDPEAIVIGGGLGLSKGLYRDRLIQHARQRIWWLGHRELPILEATLGEDAGWLGAAAAAWRKTPASSS